MSYKIFTETASDLGADITEELDIEIIPMGVSVGDDTFMHYADEREMKIRDFYARSRAGEKTGTSAVTPGGWIEHIEPTLALGSDIMVVAFSSGLSSTYDNALIAAEELRGKYPDRQVEVVDSLCASLGHGLFVRMAALKRNEGASLTELKDYLESTKLSVCHWFTVDDLVYLRRGGRVSAATAVVGGALGIKPILHVDNAGHLISVGKSRGRKNSLKALADHMEETAVNPSEQYIMISHGDCLEEAEALAADIKARLNVRGVYINHIGPLIGAHSGPGTMALFFIGTER